MKEKYIDKLNLKLLPSKIPKKYLRDGDYFIELIYKQFGIKSIDELVKLSKKDKQWYSKFKWNIETERQFKKEVLSRVDPNYRFIVEPAISFLILDVGPSLSDND